MLKENKTSKTRVILIPYKKIKCLKMSLWRRFMRRKIWTSFLKCFYKPPIILCSWWQKNFEICSSCKVLLRKHFIEKFFPNISLCCEQNVNDIIKYATSVSHTSDMHAWWQGMIKLKFCFDCLSKDICNSHAITTEWIWLKKNLYRIGRSVKKKEK